MPNLMNIANAEAQDAIVTFGRDMSVAESTTMTITENGTYDVRKKAQVIVEVEGNPNYKETFTGKSDKLEAYEGFHDDLVAGNASAYIKIDVTPLQMGQNYIDGWLYSYANQNYFLLAGLIGSTVAASKLVNILWNYSTGDCGNAVAMTGGQIMDLTAYMSMLDYTLTVYHHPMPEDEEP